MQDLGFDVMVMTQVTMLTITIIMQALNNSWSIAPGMQNYLEEAPLAKRDFFYIQTPEVVTVFLIIQSSVQDHDADCCCDIAFGKSFQCSSQSMFEKDRSIVSTCHSLPTCCHQDKYTITYLV